MKHSLLLYILLGLVLISIPFVVLLAFPLLPIWAKLATLSLLIIAIFLVLIIILNQCYHSLIDFIYCNKNQILTELKDLVSHSLLSVQSITESAKVDTLVTLSEKVAQSEGRIKAITAEQASSLSETIIGTEKHLLDNSGENRTAITEIINDAVNSGKQFAEAIKTNTLSALSERITQTERVIQSSATDQKSHLTEVISSNQQAIKSAVFEVVVNSGTKNKDIITNVLTTQADSISKVNELITSVFNLVLKIDRDSLPVIVDGLKPQFENNREYLTIANSSLFQQLRLLQATIFSIASRETPKENIRREGGGISVFEYKNEQTGETVVNREKDHILTSSQLFIEKKLVFEIQYDKEGRICHSKNYSKDGRMTSELTFHPNGQIATRRQFILKDGKISTLITRFDNIGNKIS